MEINDQKELNQIVYACTHLSSADTILAMNFIEPVNFRTNIHSRLIWIQFQCEAFRYFPINVSCFCVNNKAKKTFNSFSKLCAKTEL